MNGEYFSHLIDGGRSVSGLARWVMIVASSRQTVARGAIAADIGRKRAGARGLGGTVVVAALLAAGSAAGQTAISTTQTINSQVSYNDGLTIGSTTDPGPTVTIASGAAITVGIGSFTPTFTVGTNLNPYAAVIQNGGSVTTGGSLNSQLYLGMNLGTSSIAYDGAASYTLNAGTITLGATDKKTGILGIGRSSQGTFTQAGGTVTAYRDDTVLFIGSGNGKAAEYSISGGTFNGIGSTGAGPGLGVAAGSGGLGTLTINGGTVAVQPGNTWLTVDPTGSATVDLVAGTLALNGNVTRGRPNSGSAPGAVNFTLGGGTLRPYDANLVVGPSTAANTAAFDVTLAANTTSTITGVGWKTGSIHTVTMDSPLIGSGNIDFAGGTVSLSAANTFSGTTTISAGTLALGAGGSLANSTAISVGSGATFDVSALPAGLAIAADQSLGGTGSILGSLTFGADSKLAFSSSLTVDSGTVTFNGFGINDIIGLDGSLVSAGTYTLLGGTAIFDLTNALNVGAGNAVNIGGGKSAYLQEGSFQVVVVPVPEPAGLTVAGLGIAAAAWALRRRPAAG
jgi:fibronectin-binding autotransporter adhesin